MRDWRSASSCGLSCSLICLIVVAVGAACGAASASARDCAVAEEAAACSSNEDCTCGLNAAQTCEVGARECVSADTTGACYALCSGFGDLTFVCRAGRCIRAAAARCPGDCDADASVQVSELVTGVAITLGARAQAACSSYDRNASGSTEIDELIAAVVAALDGCAATLTRYPDDRGAYDGMVTSSGEITGTYAVVADVSELNDGLNLTIYVTPNVRISLSGPLDGTDLTLDGHYWITDVVGHTAGTATVEDRGDEEVIEGTLMSPEPFGLPSMTSFVLRRSRIARPARFAGHYRFEAVESPSGNGLPSVFDFGILVAPNGTALTSEGRDVGADEQPFGRLVSGTCRIAPQGHFHCATVYLIAGSDLTTPLRLTGVLPEEGASAPGSGRFLSGYDPPFGPEPYVPSVWTATRE